MPATERSVTEAVPAEAPEGRFDKRRLARLMLVLLAGFAVVYLTAANSFLRTRFLRDVISAGPDVELDYASAYSVWPGRVHVRGFSLALQTHGDQLSVTADSGVVTISLHELLFSRFHATQLEAQGLRFRYRQKVTPEESRTTRVAAYPPISGYPDPPLYDGQESPPATDAEYDLWQIVLDDVQADLGEVWFLEYRYVGAGSVRGGFRLQPARSFALYPVRLELQSGKLSVGAEVAVERLDIELEGHIVHTDVQEDALAALAENMTGRLRLQAQNLDLAALDSRDNERSSWRLHGRAGLTLAASALSGQLEPESSAELTGSDVSLSSPIGRWSGALTSQLRVGPDQRIDWVTSSPRLSIASASRQAGPSFDSPRLAVELRGARLATGPSLHGLDLDLPALLVPSLGWDDGWVRRLGVASDIAGRVEGRAHVQLARDRGPAVRLQLSLTGATLATDDVRLALAGRIEAELESVAGDARSSAGRVDVELERVEIARGEEGSKPFRAAIRFPDPKLSLEPRFSLSTGVDIYAVPADPLLSLALGSPMLEDLAAGLFDLERLEAMARVNVNGGAVSCELTQAKSGALRGRGSWRSPAQGQAKGAFMISSKVANVGFSLVGAETKTSWLVADDWLASKDDPRSGGDPAREQAPRKDDERPRKGASPRKGEEGRPSEARPRR
jgi:hypothetical protein